MKEETQLESLRAAIHRNFGEYHLELQQRQKQQLDTIDKLAARVAKVRSSLLNDHSAELEEVQQLMRLIDWKLEAEDSVGDNSRDNDSPVEQQ